MRISSGAHTIIKSYTLSCMATEAHLTAEKPKYWSKVRFCGIPGRDRLSSALRQTSSDENNT